MHLRGFGSFGSGRKANPEGWRDQVKPCGLG
jgi:hypothetical protein